MKKIDPELFAPYGRILFFLQKGQDLDTSGAAYALLTLIKRKFPDKEFGIVGITNTIRLFPGINAFNIDSIDKLDKEVDTLGVFCDIVNSKQIGAPRFVTVCKHIYIFDHHKVEEKDKWDDKVTKRLVWEHRDPSYSSCCELIWDLIDKEKFEVTKDIAEYLCMGLISDNRGFMSSVTNKRTFEILGEMTSVGVNVQQINREYSQLDPTNLKLFCEVIQKHSFKKGKVFFMNLSPSVVRKHIPHFFQYNPCTSGIMQPRCLTYILTKAEQLVKAEVFVLIHYSLYKPHDLNRKLVYVVLTKENAICEEILRQNGFTNQRNRWIYSKGMTIEQAHNLIFVKFGNEFGVNRKYEYIP